MILDLIQTQCIWCNYFFLHFYLEISTDEVQPIDLKEEEEIVKFDSDSIHVVEVRGLPWIATKSEILNFFSDVNVYNGPNGIHFKIEKGKNQCNQAYLRLQSDKDIQQALTYNCTKMGAVVIRGRKLD